MSRKVRREVRIVGKEGPDYIIEGDRDIISTLYEQGIGDKIDDRILKVSPIELAYLTTRLKVVQDSRELKCEDVLKEIDNILRFITYLDLRKRGYNVKIVSEGSPIDLLVWEKGKKPMRAQPRYAVKIVTEGLGIRVLELSSVLKYCEAMGLQLVLALLSNDGVVTYYKAFSLRDFRTL